MTDWLVFRTPEGHDVAIPAEDITGVWSSDKNENQMVVERITYPDHPIEVLFKFNEFVKEYFDHIDIRPKKKRRGRPRTKPKATDNIIKIGEPNE
jgi:hypothetical protein